MELVRSGAADGAGVRGNRPEPEREAGEDARIGVVHIAVFALEVGVVGVERIAVLHDEFPPAHDAEAGPALIAELGLDLVEVRRQPPVALQLAPRKVGNDLLRRGLHDENALVPILEAQKLRPVRLPAARLLPQLTGLHDGHDELEGAGAIHLLAHDPLHLAHDAQAERQPRIDARRQAPDEAGAQHQPMADDLRLGGHFFLCRNKKLRGFHGPAPALSLPEACGKIERHILLRYRCRGPCSTRKATVRTSASSSPTAGTRCSGASVSISMHGSSRKAASSTARRPSRRCSASSRRRSACSGRMYASSAGPANGCATRCRKNGCGARAKATAPPTAARSRSGTSCAWPVATAT